jgi:hypothetical protein
VHPELLHGERCVLRSTMYFEFREMLDLRGKGGVESVERTGGERRTWRLVLEIRLIGGRLIGL